MTPLVGFFFAKNTWRNSIKRKRSLKRIQNLGQIHLSCLNVSFLLGTDPVSREQLESFIIDRKSSQSEEETHWTIPFVMYRVGDNNIAETGQRKASGASSWSKLYPKTADFVFEQVHLTSTEHKKRFFYASFSLKQ